MGVYVVMIVEFVLSVVGIIEFFLVYINRLKEFCEERGLFFIFDEV